jgi:hypothetical protein
MKCWSMSALGQKLPRQLTATVSALPPKADTIVAGWRFGYLILGGNVRAVACLGEGSARVPTPAAGAFY